MVLMTVLTLWHPAKAFAKSLQVEIYKAKGASQNLTGNESSRSIRCAEILDQYTSMKELSHLINNLVGHSVTLLLCTSILGYGIQLDEILTEIRNPNWTRIVTIFLYFLVDLITYGVSAGVCHKVHVQRNFE